MNDLINSFLLTTFSGLSTVVGYFIIYIKGDKNKLISFFLSFASGVMFIISVIDLIPSSITYLNNYFILFRLLIVILFFILGIFVSNCVNNLISKYECDVLKKIGFLSFVSIILHNIPEDCSCYVSQ